MSLRISKLGFPPLFPQEIKEERQHQYQTHQHHHSRRWPQTPARHLHFGGIAAKEIVNLQLRTGARQISQAVTHPRLQFYVLPVSIGELDHGLNAHAVCVGICIFLNPDASRPGFLAFHAKAKFEHEKEKGRQEKQQAHDCQEPKRRKAETEEHGKYF